MEESKKVLTLIYSAKNEKRNNAIVLMEILKKPDD